MLLRLTSHHSKPRWERKSEDASPDPTGSFSFRNPEPSAYNGKAFETLLDAQVWIERWRHQDHAFRPRTTRCAHGALHRRLESSPRTCAKSHGVWVQRWGLIFVAIAKTRKRL